MSLEQAAPPPWLHPPVHPSQMARGYSQMALVWGLSVESPQTTSPPIRPSALPGPDLNSCCEPILPLPSSTNPRGRPGVWAGFSCAFLWSIWPREWCHGPWREQWVNPCERRHVDEYGGPLNASFLSSLTTMLESKPSPVFSGYPSILPQSLTLLESCRPLLFLSIQLEEDYPLLWLRAWV